MQIVKKYTWAILTFILGTVLIYNIRYNYDGNPSDRSYFIMQSILIVLTTLGVGFYFVFGLMTKKAHKGLPVYVKIIGYSCAIIMLAGLVGHIAQWHPFPGGY